ncbi:MAG: hypothetical protein NO515_04215 [Candidatus Methanomethylicia archaeon]|jgi:uncharacterized coiled-coil DUF342 family protein|nr:hypothetical protein [Candidatus Methanomethylicia archaeon]MCQ5374211.1 hypothetical protein [Candidatus Methanomethylicia archaeon]NHV60141.1 hypothetical protein [Candidatus Verstraetearchaeota archaeon]
MENLNLGDLSRQIKQIRDSIELNYKKLDELRKKKSDIIDRLRSLREAALNHKNMRDEKNKLIAEKKQLRDQLHKEKNELSQKIKDLISKKREILSSMRESEPDLLRQLKEIDWKYQTTPLSLEEERRLLQRRSELEKKLMIFKRAREIDQEINSLKTSSEELRTKADLVHKEILSLAEESKVHHESMIKSLEECKPLSAELEQVKVEIASIKTAIESSKKELSELVSKYKEVRESVMKQKIEMLAEQTRQIITKRSELAERAAEKIKNGERLTFEEFAAMLAMKGS